MNVASADDANVVSLLGNDVSIGLKKKKKKKKKKKFRTLKSKPKYTY